MSNSGNSLPTLLLLIGVIVAVVVGLFASDMIPRRQGGPITVQLPWNSSPTDARWGDDRAQTAASVSTPNAQQPPSPENSPPYEGVPPSSGYPPPAAQQQGSQGPANQGPQPTGSQNQPSDDGFEPP